MKKVVIVGGGFAGINLIKNLSKNDFFEITLVDVNNYHFFPPLLYQVAASYIDVSNISYPFRKLFQKNKNVKFHLGGLKRVVPEENCIETDSGTLYYDYLVLAMGTEANYFGNDNIAGKAMAMKTIPDSLYLRNHLLKCLEDVAKDSEKSNTNIVIAGGGPTGVELAGVFAEMSKELMHKEYPEIPDRHGSIFLIEANSQLLGPMSNLAKKEAYKVLEKLGVKILTDTLVKDYINDEVILNNGDKINTKTLIWTSGVIAKKVAGLPDDILGRGRRIKVDGINRVHEMENVFCIGDQCLQTSDKNFADGHPQLAQVAIQQGNNLANNLRYIFIGGKTKEFKYSDNGSMAIISKYKAVVDLPKYSFKGFFAWLVWLFIHIIPLVGFTNRFKIAFNWMLSFTTNNPALRLLIQNNSIKRSV